MRGCFANQHLFMQQQPFASSFLVLYRICTQFLIVALAKDFEKYALLFVLFEVSLLTISAAVSRSAEFSSADVKSFSRTKKNKKCKKLKK
jgi:hypothetical protein